MGSVHRIVDRLDKPDLDDRTYRVIELPNKLEALLVHDAQTDKASASLCVNVGNFSDAKDMPGMAHAVEHLLFMGTEKYPVENEYSSYLSSHSGYSNAYTAATHTNYFFECAASNESQAELINGTDTQTDGVKAANRGPLYGALDRFAQFFVKPLFLEETLDRELRAVDSENKKNLQNDVWRLSQLGKSLSNPEHPYNHFSTGNLETLRDEPEKRGIKIRDAFIQFYEKHYSANRMKLVVLGRESLDELETWVADLFSEVKNQNLPQNRWDDVQPLSNEELGTEIFAKPVMESRSLELTFPWQDEDEMYETKPSAYINHLIGHEGPGSILAYLKNEGLANDLSSGASTVCPNSAFFGIRIGLTQEGLTRYHDVVKAVFQYIGMVKENPPVEWLHQEIKQMAEVDFKFQQQSPASQFTSKTSAVMQQPIPREWLLSGSRKHRRFDANAIVSALQFLRKDNFRVMIVSQDFPGDWNEREKWYGTEYKVERMSTAIQEEVRKALEASAGERPVELHLPHKNEFIPTRLDVEKIDVQEPAPTPKLLRNDDLVRLWWKKDDTFWVPKASVSVVLRNSQTYSTPANYVKTVLYLNLVKDALVEYSYDADIAGLGYDIGANLMGIDLSVYGYNDKMAVLLEKILTTLKTLEIGDDRFDIIKEKITRKWKNWDFQQPFYQIGDFTRMLTDEKAWFTPVYAKELPQITVEDIRTFAPLLLAQVHIELFVHGNVYREEAKKMGALIESTLRPRPLPQSQWELRRNVLLAPGDNFNYKHKLGDPENVNHAIEYYLQIGDSMDIDLRSRVMLLGQMTDEPAFDQLRTKEQLGYVVWSGARNSTTTIGYRVLIQSERDPDYLESRIDAFLLKFRIALDTMSESDFDGHKRSLINKRLEKLKNLNSETSRLWGYINSEYFNFFQVDVDVAAIRKLTKEDMIAFYDKFIDPKSATRAKLAVHLHAQKSARQQRSDPAEQKNQLIDLISQYLSTEYPATQADDVKIHFVDVKPHDKAAIAMATKTYLKTLSIADAQTSESVLQLQNVLPDMMLALKITLPADEQPSSGPPTPVTSAIANPTVIEDVHQWKAGLQISQAPVPVMDITELEDNSSKL